MRDVQEIAALAAEIVERFCTDVHGLVDAEVHHIGATALPSGHTKGDVDVNIRVATAEFPAVVAALAERFDVAQPENWSPTFASFSTGEYELPFGIQLTVAGSDDDFLLALHERIKANPHLAHQYDEVKLRAAPRGSTAYWAAKNDFLRGLLKEERP
jgi:GrpB-like predicted nucleotidyltransferase (UPF0157 family)